MIGRLFRFFVLAFVVIAVVRWLLGYRGRQTLREWVVTLAQALVISALIFLGLYFFGIRPH